jgi:PAS domain S-box-containing protein
LQTNGGKSLKDAVVAMRLAISTLDGKFHYFASFSQLIAWESDKFGNYTWVSPKLLQLLGRDATYFHGQSWRSLIATADRDRVFKEWDSAIEQERAFIMEFGLVKADGEIVPVIAETYCIRSANGEVGGFVGIFKLDLEHESH